MCLYKSYVRFRTCLIRDGRFLLFFRFIQSSRWSNTFTTTFILGITIWRNKVKKRNIYLSISISVYLLLSIIYIQYIYIYITTLRITQKWSFWTDRLLVKYPHKTTTSKMWSFWAGFQFFTPGWIPHFE